MYLAENHSEIRALFLQWHAATAQPANSQMITVIDSDEVRSELEASEVQTVRITVIDRLAALGATTEAMTLISEIADPVEQKGLAELIVHGLAMENRFREARRFAEATYADDPRWQFNAWFVIAKQTRDGTDVMRLRRLAISVARVPTETPSSNASNFIDVWTLSREPKDLKRARLIARFFPLPIDRAHAFSIIGHSTNDLEDHLIAFRELNTLKKPRLRDVKRLTDQALLTFLVFKNDRRPQYDLIRSVFLRRLSVVNMKWSARLKKRLDASNI